MHSPPETPPPQTSAASRFFVAHWRIGRAVHEYVSPRLEQNHGLSYRDFLVLTAVTRGVHYPTELSEKLKLPKDTMSRIVQTLLQAGLLERTIDPADSRRTRLEATLTGQQLHAEVKKSIEGLLEPLLEGLGWAQREQFLGLLETFGDRLAAPPVTSQTPDLKPVGER